MHTPTLATPTVTVATPPLLAPLAAALMSFGGFALALSNFLLFPALAKCVAMPLLFTASTAALVAVYAAPPFLTLAGPALLPYAAALAATARRPRRDSRGHARCRRRRICRAAPCHPSGACARPPARPLGT